MYANYTAVKAIERQRYGQERNYQRRRNRERRPARKAAQERRSPVAVPASQIGRT